MMMRDNNHAWMHQAFLEPRLPQKVTTLPLSKEITRTDDKELFDGGFMLTWVVSACILTTLNFSTLSMYKSDIVVMQLQGKKKINKVQPYKENWKGAK